MYIILSLRHVKLDSWNIRGNVRICTSMGNIVIDNMMNGFDLYLLNWNSLIRIQTHRKFVKMASFGETGKIVACGSDHGKAYVFGIGDKEPKQILNYGGQEQMIQVWIWVNKLWFNITVRRKKPGSQINIKLRYLRYPSCTIYYIQVAMLWDCAKLCAPTSPTAAKGYVSGRYA